MPSKHVLECARDICYEMNQEDTSVGIYRVHKIDADVVKWVEAEFEGVKVIAYTPKTLTLSIAGEQVEIVLQSNEYSSRWTLKTGTRHDSLLNK